MALSYAFLAFQALQTTVSYRTVTFRTMAKPASKVMQELSEIAHVQLRADPEAAKEILLISVKGKPLRYVMEKIVSVSSCRWRQDPDGYTLIPDVKRRAIEAAQEREANVKIIEGVVGQALRQSEEARADYLAELQKGKSPEQLQEPSPGDLAMKRLVAMIDPSVIGELPPDERSVWVTSNPTAGQYLLAPEALLLIEQATANQNNVPDDMTVSKALVAVQYVRAGRTVSFEVEPFDNRGARIQDLTLELYPDESVQETPETPSSADDPKIEYSDDSRQLMADFAKHGVGLTRKISTSLWEKIAHPEEKDPLAYMVSDRYLAYADSKGLDLVADVPDSAMLFHRRLNGLPQRTTLGQVETELKGTDPQEFQEVESRQDRGALAISPKWPATNRETRVDRVALRGLLVSGGRHGPITLDSLCDFAATSPSPDENLLVRIYTDLAAPDMRAYGGLVSGPSWRLLRFYASLDPERRMMLRSGATLSFATLTSYQRECLNLLLFSNTVRLDPMDHLKQPDLYSQTVDASTMDAGTETLISEPTEAMPNGFPIEGSLSMAISSQPILSLGPKPETPARFLNMSDLAFLIAADNSGSVTRDLPVQALLGQETLLDFTFQVSPRLGFRARLMDPSIPADAKVVSLSNLPADLQAELDSLLPSFRKAFAPDQTTPPKTQTPP